MKISMICFSLTGQETGERLANGLKALGHQVLFAKKSRYIEDSIEESSRTWAQKQFEMAQAIIFVGACGIAVRSIAPFIQGKKTDPAVLVTDECGKFVISLLSGHLGGANELAVTAAELLKAVPVVTTATDLHQQFAVDVFAKKNGCDILHMKEAKETSAALLAGERVGFYSEYPFDGRLPKGLVLCDEKGRPMDAGEESPRVGISVSVYKNRTPFPVTTAIVPKTITIGMGCKKDRDPQAVIQAGEECVRELGIYQEAVEALATIELKKEEPGLHALKDKWKLPLLIYREQELLGLAGDFTSSAFVRSVAGVDNVCERSAVLGSCHGHLIQKKTGRGGVTTAAAEKKWRISFE